MSGLWSDSELDHLRALIADGTPCDKWPRLIGRSKSAVAHQVSRLGLGRQRRIDVKPARLPRGPRGTKEVPTYLRPDDPGLPDADVKETDTPQARCHGHLADLIHVYPQEARRLLAAKQA